MIKIYMMHLKDVILKFKLIILKYFRNRLNRELKKAKKNYYTKYFEENNNNIKTWEGIRSIINIK